MTALTVDISSPDNISGTFHLYDELTLTVQNQTSAVRLRIRSGNVFYINSGYFSDTLTFSLNTSALVRAFRHIPSTGSRDFTFEIIQDDEVIYDSTFRIWNHTAPAGSNIVSNLNVTSVNGKTGTVVLDAADVGAMPLNGMTFEPLTSAASVSIPAGGKAYTLAVDQPMTLAFPSPGDATCYFWLYLTTGSTAYAVTFDDTIQWDSDSGPDLSSANSLFRLAFLWDVPNQKWLGSQFWPTEALT